MRRLQLRPWLQRWPEAQEAYTTSADSAVKSFASIPRSNAALVAFERGHQQFDRELPVLVYPLGHDGEESPGDSFQKPLRDRLCKAIGLACS